MPDRWSLMNAPLEEKAHYVLHDALAHYKVKRHLTHDATGEGAVVSRDQVARELAHAVHTVYSPVIEGIRRYAQEHRNDGGTKTQNHLDAILDLCSGREDGDDARASYDEVVAALRDLMAIFEGIGGARAMAELGTAFNNGKEVLRRA